jgi:hypothetical protein
MVGRGGERRESCMRERLLGDGDVYRKLHVRGELQPFSENEGLKGIGVNVHREGTGWRNLSFGGMWCNDFR